MQPSFCQSITQLILPPDGSVQAGLNHDFDTVPPGMRCGAGNCSKCSCRSYSKDINSDNDYCVCGHSYGDHW